METASAKLDGIIQKLVEFSNDECVIVSSLAIGNLLMSMNYGKKSPSRHV